MRKSILICLVILSSFGLVIALSGLSGFYVEQPVPVIVVNGSDDVDVHDVIVSSDTIIIVGEPPRGYSDLMSIDKGFGDVKIFENNMPKSVRILYGDVNWSLCSPTNTASSSSLVIPIIYVWY